MLEDTAFGFHMIVHFPTDMEALGQKVAQAHADAVLAYIRALSCSAVQKRMLIDAIIT